LRWGTHGTLLAGWPQLFCLPSEDCRREPRHLAASFFKACGSPGHSVKVTLVASHLSGHGGSAGLCGLCGARVALRPRLGPSTHLALTVSFFLFIFFFFVAKYT
jgi:hypothetical protein